MVHNNQTDFPYDLDSISQCEFPTFVDSIIEMCHVHQFEMESIQMLQLLNQLKHSRTHYGKDHPSLTSILSTLNNMIGRTSFSYLAIPFLMEQLRIEKLYLGCNDPDLASILYSIGHIYETYDKVTEAEKYLADALDLLNKNQRKGQLYALVTYRLGIVNYQQSLYKDAMEMFSLAMIEQQAECKEFYPAVAEMHINIKKFQPEI